MVIRAALGDVLGNPIPANTKMRIRIFIFAASPIPVPIRQHGSQHFIAAQLNTKPFTAIKLYGIKTYFITHGCCVSCNNLNNGKLMSFNDIMEGRKKVEQSIREHQ